METMKIHWPDNKLPAVPNTIPMNLLDENQAMINHGQTLAKLNERGGVSCWEALCLMDKKTLREYAHLTKQVVLIMFRERLNPTP